MVKKLLIGISIFTVLLLVGFTYVSARLIDREEILRARTEMEVLRASRDSMLRFVAIRDSMQREIQREVSVLKSEAESLRFQVGELERARRASELSVRRLRRPEELKERLSKTYPEMAASDWGVSTVHNEENDVALDYLMVPLWFSETFIIEHQDAQSFRAQRDKLLAVDSLQTDIGLLKDRVLQLEQEKGAAYKAGFDSAYTKYEALNREYVALLQKPRVSLGLPAAGTLLGAAAAGVIAGVLISR